jgi:hypothetical protein
MWVLIYLVFAILYIAWTELNIRRKKKRVAREVNAPVVNRVAMAELSKQAKRRERTAMQYLVTKQKSVFRRTR